jgi:cell division protease FtsH
VEIPLPDAVGRRRLLALYGPQLQLGEQELTEVVERTEGTTASFTKELVRRAVLIAAERGASETTAVDVRAAVDELLSDRDALTRRLLGGRQTEQPGGPATMPAPPGGNGSSWQMGR